MGEELVLHINGWLLVTLAFSGLGLGIWIIYRLLLKVSELTIQGIKQEIHECQTELAKEIADAHTKAEFAHKHADSAHKRVGRIESALINNGVKLTQEKE